MTDTLSILIASITLAFTIGWTLWFYRKQQTQKLNLYLDAAVISNHHSGMYFTPKGSKKREKIPRGSFVQTMISLKVQNIGATPATINKFVAKAEKNSITIPLDNLWLLTEEKDENRLPKVLLPGQFWEGFIDWFALKTLLESYYGSRVYWDVTIHCIDTNNKRHVSTYRYSENVFKSIIESRKNENY